MSDERRDDEMLGRALARAIETQRAHETPYERSRLAARPARRGFPIWQALGAAAVLVLALAFGAWFTRPRETPPAAATSTPSEAPTSTPAATATPEPGRSTYVVYTWRDGLPPVLRTVSLAVPPSAPIEERIKARLDALNSAVSGLSGTILSADPKQFYVRSVRIDGETAVVDYSATFPVSGTLGDTALAQQIVYTATEDPTVRRVLVTENGAPMSTGHILWDKPLAREDVAGYAAQATDSVSAGAIGDVPASELRSSTSYSVDSVAPGLARFVIRVERTGGALPREYTPPVDVRLYGPSAGDQSGLGGKASLWITVPWADPNVGLRGIDRSPLRSVNTVPSGGGTIYQLKLDAAYPWRVFTLQDPARIVVDVGGATQAVSDRIAVYSPALIQPVQGGSVATPPSVGRTFTLSGAARTFEANVVWRVKDSRQSVVAEGNTTASLGTSAVWGAFGTQVTLPASVAGNVTLEVFEVSAKDGSEQGVVAIPLTVR